MTRRLPLVAAALLVPALLGAQGGERTPEERLQGRLSDPARRQVLALVDSARGERLPADELVTRALEGASKRAPDDRIVAAVRRLRAALAEARRALGQQASGEEVAAGASAIQARVPTGVLAALRRE
ncbi:MAG TPA: hypothetical protein VFY16_13915, partial [Gemmatimonadaceae bacterium]|nr:hypothetical protein [Gemmatimonadaceae bacterium]